MMFAMIAGSMIAGQIMTRFGHYRLLALVGIWHNQICGYATRAVLPYDQRLSRLPATSRRPAMPASPAWLRPGARRICL